MDRRESGNRSTRGIQWQRDYQAAVTALEEAEREYQRTIAGSAFLSSEDPSSVEVQRDALNRLEEARRHLDDVRQSRPRGDVGISSE